MSRFVRFAFARPKDRHRSGPDYGRSIYVNPDGVSYFSPLHNPDADNGESATRTEIVFRCGRSVTVLASASDVLAAFAEGGAS